PRAAAPRPPRRGRRRPRRDARPPPRLPRGGLGPTGRGERPPDERARARLRHRRAYGAPHGRPPRALPRPGAGYPAIIPVTPARIIATAMAARNRLATFATAFDVLGPKNRSSPGPNVNATYTRSMLRTMLASVGG